MKRFLSILLICALIISLSACGTNTEKAPDDKISNNSVPIDAFEEKINTLMCNMSLEEKIAQMLIISYDGDTADETLTAEISSVKPGGFILFDKNITTYENTKKLVNTLQSLSDIPMIISIDQEGGSVQRMNALTDPSATYIPDMYSLGSMRDKLLAEKVGKVMAEEMRTIGINTVFGPVLDVIPDVENSFIARRSFGTDAAVVSEIANSLAYGLEQNKVVPVYKHFPGHGDTKTDSHTELPVINKSLQELEAREFVPFKTAIKRGAKIIMIGHIALPAVTGDNTPATLSKYVVTDILKVKLGYNGLVVTDALNMEALTDNYSEEEIYIKAVEAGCDLLLMPEDSAKAVEIIKNNISVERIDQSVRKILNYKYKYLDADNTLDSSYLGSTEHKEIISQIHG